MQPAQTRQDLQNAEQQRVDQAKSGVKSLRRIVSGSFVATPSPFVELIMTTQNIEIRFYPKHHWPHNESKKIKVSSKLQTKNGIVVRVRIFYQCTSACFSRREPRL